MFKTERKWVFNPNSGTDFTPQPITDIFPDKVVDRWIEMDAWVGKNSFVSWTIKERRQRDIFLPDNTWEGISQDKVLYSVTFYPEAFSAEHTMTLALAAGDLRGYAETGATSHLYRYFFSRPFENWTPNDILVCDRTRKCFCNPLALFFPE